MTLGLGGEVLATADAALLVAALHRLHADWRATTAPRELATRCCQMVGTAFHWPTLLPAYAQMYEQALAA